MIQTKEELFLAELGINTKEEFELAYGAKIKITDLLKKYEKQLTLTDVVICVCKIPEPRLKVSENGTHAYCNNCAKTYWQK